MSETEKTKCDLISRAEAIEAVMKYAKENKANADKLSRKQHSDVFDKEITEYRSRAFGYANSADIINALPSAETPTTDLISREDVVREIAEWGQIATDNEIDMAIKEFLSFLKERIDTLPSAEAEQVTSKLKNPCDSLLTDDSAECKEQKSKLEHDREWIVGCIEHDGFIKTDRFDKANQIILKALSAEAVQGEWIDDCDPLMRTCSNCGYGVFIQNVNDFCPNCGAKMKGGEDE